MLKDRKSTSTIQFLDMDGVPLKNTKININQTSHEFLFGWGAFDFVAATNSTKKDEQAFFQKRVDKWLEIFNYGTLPFYWGGFEPKEGQPNTKALMNAAKYMQERNITVKGHPLCWHTACADWLLKYDNQTILQKQLSRIKREVSDFNGTINIWDAINEVVIMPVFDRYDNAVTRVCKDKGSVNLVKQVFLAAKEANPNCTLLINDFNTSKAYANLIEECLEAGVPIDAIGIQSHQHQGYWGKHKIEKVLKRYEKFGLPIHFTENTIISGPKIPKYITDLNDYTYKNDASTPELEELQKTQMEEWYRTIFQNHPLVKAITGWDLTDGMWLNAPSGILHTDASEKPAFNMLKKLIKDEWWTCTEVTTDKNGFAKVEGFKGDYQASFTDQKGSFKLNDNTKDQIVVIK